MNDFETDDKYQREKRDKFLVPFYDRWWSGLFHDADVEQQARGIDTIIATMKVTVRIEEKIVRKPHNAFALETKSCTIPGHEKPGWMFYSEADRLLYCFPINGKGLDCWWIDMPALQQWFWPIEAKFSIFNMKTQNKTVGRVVPIVTVQRAKVPITNFKLK